MDILLTINVDGRVIFDSPAMAVPHVGEYIEDGSTGDTYQVVAVRYEISTTRLGDELIRVAHIDCVLH